MQQGEQDDDEEGQGEQGNEPLGRAAWTFATPRATVPSVVAERYGFRLQQSLKPGSMKELLTDIVKATARSGFHGTNCMWIFQLRTERLVPSMNGSGLTRQIGKSAATDVPIQKEKCLVCTAYQITDAIWTIWGVPFQVQAQLVAFALHTGCICIQWQSQRLLDVENWVSARLRQAAKKDGASLDSLPNAKMLEKWHSLEVSVGPLGMWASQSRTGCEPSQAVRNRKEWKKSGGFFKYFFIIFTPKLREDSHFDEHIFQMGWFNHQPASCFWYKEFIDSLNSGWFVCCNLGIPFLLCVACAEQRCIWRFITL